ncbi:glutathione S-transferase family protein [Microvirga pudoricolor]|uniref:glutathione S-transferase family protein n=1 Tax=Microvirga pudoricolor TaxID=2778729 RepID=UPI0019502CF7|nr:glutathione S-transferase family protein [Microvirga pudoricolor]MBM6596468.1 glutathione S-transferase family protein [Microvirga pudoricolor]
MTLALYAHPFSSYCQKVLAALYANGTPFEYRSLDNDQTTAEWQELWPIRRFPILVHGDRIIAEASIILEFIDTHHPGPLSLIPKDPSVALDVRLMDRFFDNYVMTPMQKIVSDRIRTEENRDPFGVLEARAMLDRSYGWLDSRMAGRTWAVGDGITMADCAAAPSLFYADWAHPIGEEHGHLRAYRQKLLAWPSFARAVDEARPYRHFFPLGAPDRD